MEQAGRAGKSADAGRCNWGQKECFCPRPDTLSLHLAARPPSAHSGRVTTPLEFYFDYASPFAYLASTQLPRICEATDAELRYRPLLLGGLFKALGTPNVPLFAMSEVKRRYIAMDMERWAKHWGVPLRFPSGFPLRTVDALRLTLLAPQERWPALVQALMTACWVEDRPIGEVSVLRACAEQAGVDPALLERLGEPEVKAELRARTDAALERGIPGVPSFFIGDHLFWGQDRLGFVEDALRGWKPPRG